MAFNISVKHDLKKLRRQLTAMELRVVPQATVTTLNRVAESAKVASVKHIGPQLGSRQAAVKRRIKTQRATAQRLWATLVAMGRKLQLIEFVVGSKRSTQQPGGKRGLVKTKVFGKTKTYKKAFIAPRRKGDAKTTMYIRKGRERLPLKLMHGPSIVDHFKQPDNERVMLAKVIERFPIEFRRNISFFLQRLKSR